MIDGSLSDLTLNIAPPRDGRWGGRAVEGTGLENRQARKRLVGSNPTPTANSFDLGFQINGLGKMLVPTHPQTHPSRVA